MKSLHQLRLKGVARYGQEMTNCWLHLVLQLVLRAGCVGGCLDSSSITSGLVLGAFMSRMFKAVYMHSETFIPFVWHVGTMPVNPWQHWLCRSLVLQYSMFWTTCMNPHGTKKKKMNVDQAMISKIKSNLAPRWNEMPLQYISNHCQRAQRSPSCFVKVTGTGIGCFDNMLPKYVTSTDDGLPKLCPINKQRVGQCDIQSLLITWQ